MGKDANTCYTFKLNLEVLDFSRGILVCRKFVTRYTFSVCLHPSVKSNRRFRR